MAEYDNKGGYESGYGKRPMWQWILLYVIIGGILYYGVYYYFLKDNYSNDGSGGLYGSSSSSPYDYGTGTDSSSASPDTDLQTSTDTTPTDTETESADQVLDEGATTTE